MASGYVDLGQRSELIASAAQEYLRSLSRNPDPIWGRTRLHLVHWSIDAFYIDDTFLGIGHMVEPRIREWISSDEGAWALDSISGIEVAGLYDVTVDHVRLLVSARVDEITRVEHAMRFS